jgi:hypothetical protein
VENRQPDSNTELHADMHLVNIVHSTQSIMPSFVLVVTSYVDAVLNGVS